MTPPQSIARTEHAPWRRIIATVSLTTGTAAAFALGIYAQRHLSAPIFTGATVQLAQASQERGASAFAGSGRHRERSLHPKIDADSPAATLETVYSLVREHYVDSLPDDSAMSHGAVRSLLSALHDPCVFFLTPSQRTIVEKEAQGKYSGIGAALDVRQITTSGYTENKIEIVSAVSGSPAQKAGLRPHDLITRIDGRWVLGSDPFLKVDNLVARLQAQKLDSDTDEVARETTEARRQVSSGIGLVRAQMALRGDLAALDMYHLPTDLLKLTVVSQGSAASRVVEVQLRDIDADPPSVSLAAGNLTMIKIPAFTGASFDTIKRALSAAPASSRGIVLDLRGNSGGVGNGLTAMQAAEKVDGLLCPSGIGLMSEFAVEKLAGNRVQTLRSAATGEDKTSTCSVAPILVLVDNGTAAAAEALAEALIDAGRAKLIGQQTFGCAAIQGVYDLPNGSGFVLSTAQLSSPKHVEWANRGLTPSVVLPTGVSDAQIMARAAAIFSENHRIVADSSLSH